MIPVEIIAFGALGLAAFLGTGLFAGLETGVYTLNRVRLTVRADRSERAALRLRQELAHPSRTLSTLLIGTNTCSYMATFALAELLHRVGLTDWTLILVEAAIFTPLLFIFAETLPKDLFRTHTDHWTYTLSGVLTATRWTLTACGLLLIVQVASGALGRLLRVSGRDAVSARQRISQLIKEGLGTGLLSESQTTLADRALAMRGRRVAREMIPWTSVVTLDLNADHAAREALIRRRNYTRMPVADDDGRVVGIASTLDALLAPDKPTARIMAEPLTFEGSMPVREALRVMRTERRKMAIVINPQDGRPRGLVTLKDLVEPVTGELGAW